MRIPLLLLLVAGPPITLPATADTDGYFRRDRNVAVTQRPRPEYEAAPLRVGGFLVDAKLQAEGAWSDNIYAAEMSPTSDFILAVRPSLDLATLMDVHSIEASLFADYQYYLENTDESVLDGGGRVLAQLEFTQNTSVSASGHFAFRHEPRSGITNNVSAKSPIAYAVFGAALTAQREFGRLRALVEGSLQGEDFSDGETRANTPIEQDYRDHTLLFGRLQVDYALGPSTAIFARGRYETVSFAENTPQGNNRNQSGYIVDLGADFDISNLARGQIAAGYLIRQFEDSSVDDISGLSVDAMVSWFPSPLLTLTADAGRRVRVSGLSVSSAFVEQSASVRIDYELRQNILAFAEGRIGEDSYDNISLTDSYTTIRGGALWLLNRRIAAELSAQHRNGTRSSSPDETGASISFSENRVGIALVVRP